MISPNDQEQIERLIEQGATENEAYALVLDFHDEMRQEEDYV